MNATAKPVDVVKENAGGDEPELEDRDVVDTQDSVAELMMARIRTSSYDDIGAQIGIVLILVQT